MSKLAIAYSLKKRAKRMSEGGIVSNSGSGDELDDLHKDDHLEGVDSGAADGDDLGEPEEVKNEDMVSRILRKRK